MYHYIKGLIVKYESPHCFLESNDVGYKILIPPNLEMPKENSQCLLYVHMIIDDKVYLVGFPKESQKNLFENLISINGVGVKTAMNIVGYVPIKSLLEGDAYNLMKIPGIGKKMCERIIEKMKAPAKDPILEDAYKALKKLGYSHDEIDFSLKEVREEGDDMDKLLPKVLKFMYSVRR